jgi:hypothetical protein
MLSIFPLLILQTDSLQKHKELQHSGLWRRWDDWLGSGGKNHLENNIKTKNNDYLVHGQN